MKQWIEKVHFCSISSLEQFSLPLPPILSAFPPFLSINIEPSSSGWGHSLPGLVQFQCSVPTVSICDITKTLTLLDSAWAAGEIWKMDLLDLILLLLQASCMTLDRSWCSSVPPFPYLWHKGRTSLLHYAFKSTEQRFLLELNILLFKFNENINV